MSKPHTKAEYLAAGLDAGAAACAYAASLPLAEAVRRFRQGAPPVAADASPSRPARKPATIEQFRAAGLDESQASCAFAAGFTVEKAVERFTSSADPAAERLALARRDGADVSIGDLFVPLASDVETTALAVSSPAPAPAPVFTPSDYAVMRATGVSREEYARRKALATEGTTEPPPAASGELTADDLAFCKALGVKPEALLAARKLEASK